VLHGKRAVPVAYAVLDVLELEGEPTTNLPHVERRGLLESLELAGGFWFLRRCSTTGRTGVIRVRAGALEGVVVNRATRRTGRGSAEAGSR
jgi:hypothetical protein